MVLGRIGTMRATRSGRYASEYGVWVTEPYPRDVSLARAGGRLCFTVWRAVVLRYRLNAGTQVVGTGSLQWQGSWLQARYNDKGLGYMLVTMTRVLVTGLLQRFYTHAMGRRA